MAVSKTRTHQNDDPTPQPTIEIGLRTTGTPIEGATVQDDRVVLSIKSRDFPPEFHDMLREIFGNTNFKDRAEEQLHKLAVIQMLEECIEP